MFCFFLHPYGLVMSWLYYMHTPSKRPSSKLLEKITRHYESYRHLSPFNLWRQPPAEIKVKLS